MFEKWDLSELPAGKVIIGNDREGALVDVGRFGKTALYLLSKCGFHQVAEVARVETNAALRILSRL